MGKKKVNNVSGIYDCGGQKIDYSTGFLVGKTPLDKVVISLYNDIPALPNTFEIELDSEGRFVDETPCDEDVLSIQRVVQNIIQLDKDTAVGLARTILSMLEEENDSVDK